MAGGFLDVHVLARFAGEYGCRRVPVVRGGNPHGIDILVLKNPPHVADRLGGLALGFLNCGSCPGSAACIHITHVGNIHRLVVAERAQVGTAHASRADYADGDFFVGTNRACREGQRKGGGGGGFDEFAAVGGFHF